MRLILVFVFLFSIQAHAFKIEDYKGKVVYLDFWASWCAPCKLSFPWMIHMHEKYKTKDLVVIAVNLDTEKADGEKFLKPFKANFIIEYDPEGKLSEKFQVEAMPTSILFDRNGKILKRHTGFVTKNAEIYEKEITTALGL